jgi:hypothetical protein
LADTLNVAHFRFFVGDGEEEKGRSEVDDGAKSQRQLKGSQVMEKKPPFQKNTK